MSLLTFGECVTNREKLEIDLTLKLKQAIKNQDEFAVSILLTRLHNAGFKVKAFDVHNAGVKLEVSDE